MKSRELKTLIRLLTKFKRQHPQFISVTTVLALAQTLEALEQIKERQRKESIHG